jgi:hypothetical protein
VTRGWLVALAGFGGLAVLAGAILVLPFDWQNERVQQATIAALVVAVGWFAGFVLRELSQQLSRAERLRDVHRALYAEIRHNLGNLGSEAALQDYGLAMLARIRDMDGFVPFIPRERNDSVFRAVVSEIHILPRVTIDPIVQYYSQLAALDALVEDMRGRAFAEMDPRRRAEIYADYINIKINLLEYGEEAMRVLDAYPKSSRAETRALAARIRAEREERRKARSGDADQ